MPTLECAIFGAHNCAALHARQQSMPLSPDPPQSATPPFLHFGTPCPWSMTLESAFLCIIQQIAAQGQRCSISPSKCSIARRNGRAPCSNRTARNGRSMRP